MTCGHVIGEERNLKIPDLMVCLSCQTQNTKRWSCSSAVGSLSTWYNAGWGWESVFGGSWGESKFSTKRLLARNLPIIAFVKPAIPQSWDFHICCMSFAIMIWTKRTYECLTNVQNQYFIASWTFTRLCFVGSVWSGRHSVFGVVCLKWREKGIGRRLCNPEVVSLELRPLGFLSYKKEK